MNLKLTLAISLLFFALAEARNININTTSTNRLENSGDPLTPADQELVDDHQALNKGFPFVITVKTGNTSYVGPNARVYIIMYGSDGKKNVEETSAKIWLEGGVKDGLNNTYLFNVEVDKMISPISKIEIGIDNSVLGLGLFLDYVTIYSPSTGIKQYFPCHQWLALDEGDKVIQRTLYEKVGIREKRALVNWKIWVWTSDRRLAGTDANVFVRLYGQRGMSRNIQLDDETNNFERGRLDTFYFTTPDLGRLTSILVWHDNTLLDPGWHLNKIEIRNLRTSEEFTFYCNRWLATTGGERRLSVELPVD